MTETEGNSCDGIELYDAICNADDQIFCFSFACCWQRVLVAPNHPFFMGVSWLLYRYNPHAMFPKFKKKAEMKQMNTGPRKLYQPTHHGAGRRRIM